VQKRIEHKVLSLVFSCIKGPTSKNFCSCRRHPEVCDSHLSLCCGWPV
jgi:hypothetical protein